MGLPPLISSTYAIRMNPLGPYRARDDANMHEGAQNLLMYGLSHNTTREKSLNIVWFLQPEQKDMVRRLSIEE